MRILFCTWAWPTHYQPMVTLGWAFRAAGHDVRVASQPSLVPVVRASGLPAVAVGRDEEIEPAVARLLAADPRVRGSGKESRTVSAYAGIAEKMAGPLLALMRSWRPDLVVFEESTYAAALVATALGVPAVRHLWGVDILSYLRSFEPAALAATASSLGLSTVDVAGAVTVDHCPPALQVPGDFTRRHMRYVPFNGATVLPAWAAGPRTRPRICVTYGTTSSQLAFYECVIDRLVHAAAGLPVEVVATVAGNDLAAVGPVPGNVRIVERIPLHTLLPSCDLLISQAGPSTALTAVSCGTPQLMIPQLPDQRLISTLVSAAGAGIKLDLAEADTETIRTAAAEILGDAAYREAAAGLARESREQPSPAEVVDGLVALAR
ncbi:glycosyltransferase [Amycolatopsis mediterranei]|uniref:glycosyltransferase n=1 Tax=Amycolatopsis mediterranei TaxID=33910 RepID=UPI00341A04C0